MKHGTGQKTVHRWHPWPGNKVLCVCGRGINHPVHDPAAPLPRGA